ncbi:MAG: delta-60 repeat domain-containing protein, partial [Isosphaeraceae bacterium]
TRNTARPATGWFGGRWKARRSGTARRRRHEMRPTPESLEGRTLLSVGLDPTWGMGGISAVVVLQDTSTTYYSESNNTLALQNGQVVVAGTLSATTSSSSGSTTTTNLVVSRLTTSGALDSTFGSAGTATIPLTMGGVAYTISTSDPTAYVAVQSNGAIDVLETIVPTTPSSANSEFMIVQLTPNGAVDPSFGTSGAQFITFGTSSAPDTNTSAAALAIGPNGKLVAFGNTTLPSGDTVFAVAQLNTNGTPDATFNGTGTTTVNFHLAGTTPGNENDIGNNLVVQSNGSIVLVGSAALPANSSGVVLTNQAVARLTSAGALDTTFNGTGQLTFTYNLGGSSKDSANTVTLAGNLIVIGGTTTQVSPTDPTSSTPLPSYLTVTRLNTNGTFDTTFNGTGKLQVPLNQAGIAFNTSATAITTLADNSLLIFGSANPFNSSSETSTALLLNVLPSGALNPNYGVNGAALLPANSSNPSTEVVVQGDGKALFLSGDQVARTTAPPPAVVSTGTIVVGKGKRVKAAGVTITFNTDVNPILAGNPTAYMVFLGKGKRRIQIRKKGGIRYDASTRTLTLNFIGRAAIKAGFRVMVVPGGIVGADGQVLFDGLPTPIIIAPASSTTS